MMLSLRLLLWLLPATLARILFLLGGRRGPTSSGNPPVVDLVGHLPAGMSSTLLPDRGRRRRRGRGRRVAVHGHELVMTRKVVTKVFSSATAETCEDVLIRPAPPLNSSSEPCSRSERALARARPRWPRPRFGARAGPDQHRRRRGRGGFPPPRVRSRPGWRDISFHVLSIVGRRREEEASSKHPAHL